MTAPPARPPPSPEYVSRNRQANGRGGVGVADSAGGSGVRSDGSVPAVQLVRAYLIWPTRNVFCCWGHCMTGPVEDVGPNIFAWGLMLVPMGVYLHLWAPTLAELDAAYVPLVLACFGITLIFFVTTSFTDPGIIPRGPPLPANKEPPPPPPETPGAVWCVTCRVYRPPRASHCSDCDNCVLELDHHCPFTRNCIGARNYPFFLLFLLGVCASLAVAGGSAFLLPTTRLVAGTGADALDARHAELLIGAPLLNSILIGYCLVLSLLMWAFTGYHVALTIVGLTTKEHLKGRPNVSAACHTRLCAGCARAPSLIQPRRLVPDGPRINTARRDTPRDRPFIDRPEVAHTRAPWPCLCVHLTRRPCVRAQPTGVDDSRGDNEPFGSPRRGATVGATADSPRFSDLDLV